jgi:predicted RNA-binding Zn ribbon-like protein
MPDHDDRQTSPQNGTHRTNLKNRINRLITSQADFHKLHFNTESRSELQQASGRRMSRTLNRQRMGECAFSFSPQDQKLPGRKTLSSPLRQKLSFRFNSGRLSLNFVCTERYRPSKKIELLAEPSDFSRWLLESHAVAQPVEANQAEYNDAKKLRTAIFETISRLCAGKIPGRKSVALINEFAAKPVAKIRLDQDTWKQVFIADDPVSAGLSVVARDAIDLVTGPQARLIRVCDDPNCRMLFVDTSPGARRRWCSMTRCGSKSKGEAFRKRQEKRGN